MIQEIINLRQSPTSEGFMPSLTTYILDFFESDRARPAMIICPGGAYLACSVREKERIALAYNAAGFHAFVLDYCVAPHRFPQALYDLASAIRLVRKNAAEWNVDTEQISVIGFSAGGHLAASISTLWCDSEIFTENEINNELHKPNAAVLCYPVITSGDYAHNGSFKNLLGENENDKSRAMLSLETRVTAKTVPTFLWHTYTDEGVPVENTFLYAMALSRHKVPCEVHIYPEGKHGLSRISDETIWSVNRFRRKYDWVTESVEWLKDIYGLHLEMYN